MEATILLRTALGAIVGGAVGAGAWHVVATQTDWQLAIVNVGLALTCGLGARLAAGRGNVSWSTGAVAGVITVLAMTVVQTVSLPQRIANDLERRAVHFAVSDEMLVTKLADEIVHERQEQGEAIEWPTELAGARATEEAHFPTEIWSEARERFASLDDAERQCLRRETQDFVVSMSGKVADVIRTAPVGPPRLNARRLLTIVFAAAAAWWVATTRW